MNDSVLKLGALSRINERCLEMLQSKPTKMQAIGESKKQKVTIPAAPNLLFASKTRQHDNTFLRCAACH